MTFIGRNLPMQVVGHPLFEPGVEGQFVEEIPIEGKCEKIVAAMVRTWDLFNITNHVHVMNGRNESMGTI